MSCQVLSLISYCSDSKRLLDVEQKFKLAGVIALNLTTDGQFVFFQQKNHCLDYHEVPIDLHVTENALLVIKLVYRCTGWESKVTFT